MGKKAFRISLLVKYQLQISKNRDICFCRRENKGQRLQELRNCKAYELEALDKTTQIPGVSRLVCQCVT